jgi:hypothetical protein
VSDCCLTPNEQYEELDISKNSGKPYKNTKFDKEDILANHKSFMSLEYTLSQYDSSPPLTACTILVILIGSSFF